MSTETDQEIKALEITLEQAKKKVAFGEAFDRLRNNADFKSLILTEYLQDYAVNLVHNKASYGMQDDKNQAFINGQLMGIGQLEQFLRYVSSEAAQAAQAIVADSDTMDEIRGEAV